MNELILAGMLMSLAVVSGGMVWSQHREHHGKNRYPTVRFLGSLSVSLKQGQRS